MEVKYIVLINPITILMKKKTNTQNHKQTKAVGCRV